MAADSEAAVHKITELSVVDLKGDLQKTNLNTEGNNSALIEQLQQTKEEERRNPDEISVTPEIPGGMTPERMGKEHTVEDEIEDCGAQDLGVQQETNVPPVEADVVEEKETIAEGLWEAHSSVPTETPSEDLQLLTEYMIVTDTYQDEDNSLVDLQEADMLTLDVDKGMQLNVPKADSTQLVKEKMGIEKKFVTGNSGELENYQMECEVQGASIECTQKEQCPGTEQSNGETMKAEDEGSGQADKNDSSIIEGSEWKKSSVEDGKNTNNEANPGKGLSGNHSTSETADKNPLLSGLCSTTEVTCVKSLSSKNGKTKSEPSHKRCTVEKGRNVTGSKSSCNPRAESDRGQSGDMSSVHGKSSNRTNSRGDSRNRENDDRKDRRKGKDEHRYTSSHSRTRSSERTRGGRERSQSSERRRRRSREKSRSSERWRRRSRERSRSSERRRRRSREKSRSSERRRRRSRERSRSSERRRRRSRERSRSSERRRRRSRERSRSSERRRRRSKERSRSSEQRRRRNRERSRNSERRRSRERSRSSERRRKSRERSRSSERRRSRERRRTSRSRSQHRRSASKNRLREKSTEKSHESKEQPWQLDPKEALWAIERRREREIWEEEARELLEKDLERLQLERMCLETGRLDETALKTQRLLLEEETKREQEQIYRKREKLLLEMGHEETVKRPFTDVGAHGAWEQETRQEWDGRETLRRELDPVRYERIRLDRDTLEPGAQEKLRLFFDAAMGKEQEQNYHEREDLLPKMYYEETLKKPDIGYSPGWSSDSNWKVEGLSDHAWQGVLGTDLTHVAAVQRSLRGLYRMELAEAQRTDPSLEAVRYQTMHPNKKTDNDMGGTFLYKEGILIRRWSPKEGFFKGSEVFEEVVVPEQYRGEILKVAHNIPSSEHQGIKRTGRRLLQYFYWPSVFMDVAHYCKTCEKCRYSHKLGDVANLGLRPLPTINVPFKRVSIDVVGPLPFTTNSGKRYILMMVDCASRYPDATALVSVEADIVAMALLVMFTRVGFPEEILSNQGENFMSQLVMQLKRQCQDKQLRSTPYYPQVNELVEKFNGTLKQMLRTYAEQNPFDWDEKLQYLLFACREVPQNLTGFSPFELLYGRRVHGSLQLIKEAWLGKCFGEDKNIVEHVLNARDDLIALIEHIQEDQDHSQNSRNLWYCHNAGTRAYEVGQRVLVLLPVKRQKVQLHWEGPYTVVEPGKYVYYTVEIPFNKFRIYHVNMLKPYLDS